MIEALLPPGMASAELFWDVGEECLFDAERAAIAAARAPRRREFSTVRYCARNALAQLGMSPVPLLPDSHGAPLWPAGVVGSMTHCRGYRAAAAAPAGTACSVGIDAEPHEPLPAGVLELIALPPEREELAALGTSAHWDRVLFSAKEAVYKAWFPLARRWLGFEECHVQLARNTITARLLVPGPIINGTRLQEFHGKWIIANGLILTAVTPLMEETTGPSGPTSKALSPVPRFGGMPPNPHPRKDLKPQRRIQSSRERTMIETTRLTNKETDMRKNP